MIIIIFYVAVATSLPYSYQLIPNDKEEHGNLSAVYYPSGICDLVVQNINLGDCDKCIFVGRYKVSSNMAGITFLIPYPRATYVKNNKTQNYAVFNPYDFDEDNFEELVLEKNFTFIPMPKENATQDVIIR